MCAQGSTHYITTGNSLIPRTSPQHNTYNWGNIQESKFLYMCLISFLDYKQLLSVCLLSPSFPTPDAVAPPGLQSDVTQSPAATPTDITLLSPRDSSKQPLIPKDEDESKENCCCVVF